MRAWIAEAARSLGLGVRVGLHSGEVELMEDDVGGIAVHIAARVGALASEGEVLVSSTVKDLVADRVFGSWTAVRSLSGNRRRMAAVRGSPVTRAAGGDTDSVDQAGRLCG